MRLVLQFFPTVGQRLHSACLAKGISTMESASQEVSGDVASPSVPQQNPLDDSLHSISSGLLPPSTKPLVRNLKAKTLSFHLLPVSMG